MPGSNNFSTNASRSRGSQRLLLVTMLVAVLATLIPASPAAALSPKAAEKERIKELCKRHGLEIVHEANAQCSHGEDPAPPGKDIKRDVKPVSTPPAAEFGAAGSTGTQLTPGAPAFTCDGDGQTGFRTQVLYVRASGTPDRFATYKASFLQWAWEADQIYRMSAQDTGGLRRIRFVHDASCAPTIVSVTLSATGDDNLSNTINQLEDAGYARTDRKYMIFMDANVLCGVGTMVADDRPGQENWNNQGPDYARVDAGCWSGDIAAHEHMHTMGGVQNSAPHGSGGNHCTDEYDVMCYSDAPNYPAMSTLCPTSSRNWSRFDCNYDDYFNTNPAPGSYLATRWNTVNNRFLASDNGGSAPPAPCPDQASEPDETYSAGKPLVLGVAQARAFCVTGDQDWMSFQAAANQRYRVEIVSRAPSTTPAIEVYARNGRKLLGSRAPATGGLAVFDLRARTGGNHYVKVRNSPDTGSTGNTYSVKVSEQTPSGGWVGGFGYNVNGQVGGAAADFKATPTTSWNLGAIQVAGGVLHSAATLADGTVRTWGANTYGELGNGTTVNSTAPVRPTGLTGVTSVSAGYFHTLALKKDGTVWAWGWNGAGQLGDGTLNDRTSPVKVTGLSGVVEISAGWFHNLALKQDGTVWAWGYNETSALGDGSTTSRSVPVQVNLAQASSIAAGGYHSLATLENGTAMAWGYNGVAQLGDGSRLNRSTPAPVYGLSDTYRVSAGWTHSVALRNDGTVWAWGINNQQQAGGPPSSDRLIAGPVACGADVSCPKLAGTKTLGKISWISAGSSMHTLVLADNGTVWGWGWNAVGQLGNGTLTDSGVAVKATNLIAGDIAPGFYHSLYRA
jgi:alpha-tubulin suppressor-like RCC1 family protein